MCCVKCTESDSHTILGDKPFNTVKQHSFTCLGHGFFICWITSHFQSAPIRKKNPKN